MTQKEIDKFLANTKVYVDGKSREIQEKLFSFGFYWHSGTQVSHTEKPFLYFAEDKEIIFGNDMECFAEHKYFELSPKEILSLELDKPKYRPFKNKEECWNEMLKHQPFGWLRDKCDKSYMPIRFDIYEDTAFTYWFNKYNFADGTPLGIEE